VVANQQTEATSNQEEEEEEEEEDGTPNQQIENVMDNSDDEKRDSETSSIIVEQFINYIVGGQPVTNPIVETLICKTKNVLNKDYRYFIIIGNVIKLTREFESKD
jgi:TATA-binding protein-associated factor Taf7